MNNHWNIWVGAWLLSFFFWYFVAVCTLPDPKHPLFEIKCRSCWRWMIPAWVFTGIAAFGVKLVFFWR